MQGPAGMGTRRTLPIPPCNNVCSTGAQRADGGDCDHVTTANLPGNQIHSNFPRRQVGEPLKAHSGKHKDVFERGTKVLLRTIKIGVSISVIKEFLGLSFLILVSQAFETVCLQGS